MASIFVPPTCIQYFFTLSLARTHCSRFLNSYLPSKSISSTNLPKQQFLISAYDFVLIPHPVKHSQYHLDDPYLGITNWRPDGGIQLVNVGFVGSYHFFFLFLTWTCFKSSQKSKISSSGSLDIWFYNPCLIQQRMWKSLSGRNSIFCIIRDP